MTPLRLATVGGVLLIAFGICLWYVYESSATDCYPNCSVTQKAAGGSLLPLLFGGLLLLALAAVKVFLNSRGRHVRRW